VLTEKIGKLKAHCFYGFTNGAIFFTPTTAFFILKTSFKMNVHQTAFAVGELITLQQPRYSVKASEYQCIFLHILFQNLPTINNHLIQVIDNIYLRT